MPSVTNDTPTTWTVVDPMGTRHDPKVTESAGVVVGRPDNGYFTTHREEVAKELAERFPHMLITRHEKSHGNLATRAITFTVPRLPWKTYDDELLVPTIEPMQDTPDVGLTDAKESSESVL